MAIRTAQKTAVKPHIGNDNKRKTKNGKTTRQTPTKRPVAKIHDVKIRLSAEDYSAGLPYFNEAKYLPKFAIDAYREKVKRAEAHDKEAKQKALVGDMNRLEQVLREMHTQGKLGFLNEK
jgi:hypothetical protein